MVQVVTMDARATANEIEDQLEARDIRGLGLLAVAGATGVILAQEITERVLPFLKMPREPTTAVQFAAAGAIKLVFALVVGAVAANMSGFALVFLAFHAVGAVVFAGADWVNALQRSGVLSENTQRAPENASRSSEPRTPASPGNGSARQAGTLGA